MTTHPSGSGPACAEPVGWAVVRPSPTRTRGASHGDRPSEALRPHGRRARQGRVPVVDRPARRGAYHRPRPLLRDELGRGQPPDLRHRPSGGQGHVPHRGGAVHATLRAARQDLRAARGLRRGRAVRGPVRVHRDHQRGREHHADAAGARHAHRGRGDRPGRHPLAQGVLRRPQQSPLRPGEGVHRHRPAPLGDGEGGADRQEAPEQGRRDHSRGPQRLPEPRPVRHPAAIAEGARSATA